MDLNEIFILVLIIFGVYKILLKNEPTVEKIGRF